MLCLDEITSGVDAGLVEEPVKPRGVKWRRGFSLRERLCGGLSFMISSPADLARSAALASF